MSRVIHTVDVQYGSYREGDYEVVCDADDDNDAIKAIVRKKLDLNFLPMAYYSVRITNTQHLED